MAPPPAARGRNALTALGGGVLVLAVAGGAWALFGRSDKKGTTSASRTTTSTPAPARVLGPVVPGSKPKAKPQAKPTSITVGPVAATKAATTSPKPAPAQAVAPTKAPASVVTKAPVSPAPKPVAKPPAGGSQQGGTVAKKAYTFKVARGDTLWDLTKRTLSSTGRTTSNADVAAAVQKLYASNKGVIGSNPDLILPGQVIVWPAGL